MALTHFDEAGKARMVDVSAKPTPRQREHILNNLVTHFGWDNTMEENPPPPTVPGRSLSQ